jgi:hypothetical protein
MSPCIYITSRFLRAFARVGFLFLLLLEREKGKELFEIVSGLWYSVKPGMPCFNGWVVMQQYFRTRCEQCSCSVTGASTRYKQCSNGYEQCFVIRYCCEEQ